MILILNSGLLLRNVSIGQIALARWLVARIIRKRSETVAVPTDSQLMNSRFPFFLAFVAFMAATLWAGADASAKFNRCTDRHSIAYCNVIFYGR